MLLRHIHRAASICLFYLSVFSISAARARRRRQSFGHRRLKHHRSRRTHHYGRHHQNHRQSRHGYCR